MTSEAKEDRLKSSRIILIVFALLVGLGALAGGLTMLIDPSGEAFGMDGLLPYFQVLPLSKYLYQDYVFPDVPVFYFPTGPYSLWIMAAIILPFTALYTGLSYFFYHLGVKSHESAGA